MRWSHDARPHTGGNGQTPRWPLPSTMMTAPSGLLTWGQPRSININGGASLGVTPCGRGPRWLSHHGPGHAPHNSLPSDLPPGLDPPGHKGWAGPLSTRLAGTRSIPPTSHLIPRPPGVCRRTHDINTTKQDKAGRYTTTSKRLSQRVITIQIEAPNHNTVTSTTEVCMALHGGSRLGEGAGVASAEAA